MPEKDVPQVPAPPVAPDEKDPLENDNDNPTEDEVDGGSLDNAEVVDADETVVRDGLVVAPEVAADEYVGVDPQYARPRN